MLKLRETTHLRKEKNRVLLYDDDFYSEKGVHYLSSSIALIIAVLDQTGNEKDAIEVLTQIFNSSQEKTANILHTVLNKYRMYFETNKQIENEQLHHRYDIKDFIFPNSPPSTSPRLDFPLRLTWVTTWRCPFRCVFCGVGANRINNSNTIPVAKLMEIFESAYRMGATSLNLHGGDTIACYGDELFYALKKLHAIGYYITISTRSLISATLARELAESGLKRIQISVDTLQPEIAGRLYGSPGLPLQIKQTIKNLIEHGFAVNTNTLLTSWNIREVPAILRALLQWGVSQASLSWYRKPITGGDDLLFATDKDRAWLMDSIKGILPEIGQSIKISFNPDNAYQLSVNNQRPVCSGGRQELVILPDGKVSFCDFLASDDRFIVGDLNDQSLTEVWSSPALKDLVLPKPELFKGTICYDCREFDECQTKGRCYVRSLITCNNPFSPDYLCRPAGMPCIQFD